MSQMKIGLENEYSVIYTNSFDERIHRIKEFFNVENEFYNLQFENNNHLRKVSKVNQIKKALSYILQREITTQIMIGIISSAGSREISSFKSVIFENSPNIVYSGYGGLVFNGVHIHVSNNAINNLLSGIQSEEDYHYITDKLNTILVNLIYRNKIFSWRKLLSHHLNGYYRMSDYNFKTKNKFRHLLLKFDLRTIEFRTFELLDLLFNLDETVKTIAYILNNIENIGDAINRLNKNITYYQYNISSEYCGNHAEIKRILELIAVASENNKDLLFIKNKEGLFGDLNYYKVYDIARVKISNELLEIGKKFYFDYVRDYYNVQEFIDDSTENKQLLYRFYRQIYKELTKPLLNKVLQKQKTIKENFGIGKITYILTNDYTFPYIIYPNITITKKMAKIQLVVKRLNCIGFNRYLTVSFNPMFYITMEDFEDENS